MDKKWLWFLLGIAIPCLLNLIFYFVSIICYTNIIFWINIYVNNNMLISD